MRHLIALLSLMGYGTGMAGSRPDFAGGLYDGPLLAREPLPPPKIEKRTLRPLAERKERRRKRKQRRKR